jgi:hypothetical protein
VYRVRVSDPARPPLPPDGQRRQPGICGTIFYPRTDGDIVKLKSLIADLESEIGSPGESDEP